MFVFIMCFLIFLSVLQGKVWLIDFNPFGEVTDSLLFTWEELISERNLKGDFSEGDALEQVRWFKKKKDIKETLLPLSDCWFSRHLDRQWLTLGKFGV